MKFGQEFQKALDSEEFPAAWRDSAIEYKHLKKCIKKIHRELEEIGLSAETVHSMSEWIEDEEITANGSTGHKNSTSATTTNVNTNGTTDHLNGYYSAATPSLDTVPEEFTPQLRVLVDGETGLPLDAALAPETRASLQKLARHEMVTAGRKSHIPGLAGVAAGGAVQPPSSSAATSTQHAQWPQHPSTQHQHQQFPTHRGSVATIASSRRDSESTVMTEVDETANETGLTNGNATATTTTNGAKKPEPRWIQIPLASAKDFFDLLAPKLAELEHLREIETSNLSATILDLGDAVEDIVSPVREGYEATRKISYRDLYFWREMFRLYLERPVFYSDTEQRRGGLSFAEAKQRLEEFDSKLRESGLLGKMRTELARNTAKKFLEVNVEVLRIMHFQEMNARAMGKILKKFEKRTRLDGEGRAFLNGLRERYPALLAAAPYSSSSTSSSSTSPAFALGSSANKASTLAVAPNTRSAIPNGPTAAGFATAIAADLNAELATKVLAIVPQLDDWTCPICYAMAWRPVNLGCCRSVFCIRCIIRLQDEGGPLTRCPVCNTEGVVGKADGRNIDFETMDFLEKFFPMEVRNRQKENERAALVREYGEEFVKPGCCAM